MLSSLVGARLIAMGAVLLLGGQPAITALSAWIRAPDAGAMESSAFAVVANGTMYEVYIVGVETDVAQTAELRQKTPGAPNPTTVKEVAVPAFDRLEMAADGVFIQLQQLKRPLKPGEVVPLQLFTDNGATLHVAALVK